MSEHSPRIIHLVQQVAAEGELPWPTRKEIQGELIKGARDVPLPNLNNIVTILTKDTGWADVLAYDEFSRKIVKRHPPAYEQATTGEWRDFDDSSATRWIQAAYGINVRTAIVAEAIPLAARQHGFHPIRDYLEGLRWDKEPRLKLAVAAYFGGELNDYNALAFTKWMISAVARIYHPGCKADCVLILEGGQGKGKTTALSILAGKEHFLDTALEIGSKDTLLAMRGKWIIEFGELDSLNRAETSRIKQFFSAEKDTVRDPFARRTEDHPRQCVFAGSTNLAEYLKDETGNRRFWPVKCGAVNTAELARERDQLWAEAVHRFKAGEAWWITPDDLELFEPEQDARYQSDEWEAIIAAFLRERALSEVALETVLREALQIDPARMDRAVQMRASSCMKRIGWAKKRVMRAGVQRTMYFKREEVCR